MDLYENDCIFDKFDCCFSGSGAHVATGSYSNTFRVVSRADGADASLEASRDPQRKRLAPGGHASKVAPWDPPRWPRMPGLPVRQDVAARGAQGADGDDACKQVVLDVGGLTLPPRACLVPLRSNWVVWAMSWHARVHLALLATGHCSQGGSSAFQGSFHACVPVLQHAFTHAAVLLEAACQER